MDARTKSVVETFKQLSDIPGVSRGDDGYRYALAWMAGARMYQLGMFPPEGRAFAMTDPSAWIQADRIVGRLCVEIIWPGLNEETRDDYQVSQAVSLVSRMLDRDGEFFLAVPDVGWHVNPVGRGGVSGISPELCDLAFELLGAERGATVWIPFDPLGQLACRAKKLGLRVDSKGPRSLENDLTRLMRAVLGEFPTNAGLNNYLSVKNESSGFRSDYAVSIPPVGARVSVLPDWKDWAAEEERAIRNHLAHGFRGADAMRLDRSDTWVPAVVWPRVRRRAVMVAAQSLLFSRGQEQRLRESWMDRECPVELVATLPGKMYSESGVSACLMVLDRKAAGREVTMADLSEFVTRAPAYSRMPRMMDVDKAIRCLEIQKHSSEKSYEIKLEAGDKLMVVATFVRQVRIDEIRDNDFNLQPSRYLRLPLELPGPRVPLGKIVEVIRSPVPTEDLNSVCAMEVGIPELGKWRPFELKGLVAPGRTVKVRERRIMDCALRRGDIVMSVKGSVGKTAIVGNGGELLGRFDDEGRPSALVVSGNCIALRTHGELVSSECLFMYFRSKEFEKQIAALLVGAVIPHITPDVLGAQVKIPVLSSIEAVKLQEKYRQLCDMEASVEIINKKISSIVDGL